MTDQLPPPESPGTPSLAPPAWPTRQGPPPPPATPAGGADGNAPVGGGPAASGPWATPPGGGHPWMQPPAAGSQAAHDDPHPAGDPPPRPPRNRRGLVIGVLVTMSVLVLAVVWAVWRTGADTPIAGPTVTGAPDGNASAPGQVQPDDPQGGPEGGPEGGIGGGSGSDPLAVDPSLPNPLPSPSDEEIAALEDVFEIIDDAELAMLDFIFETPYSADGTMTESELERARTVGAEAVEQLERLRTALEEAGESSGANAAIRVAYLVHIQDWIDWTGAVADDPTLLIAGSGAHSDAIATSADGFTKSIRDNLGDLSTLPADLSALITEIVVRGFTGSGGDPQADI